MQVMSKGCAELMLFNGKPEYLKSGDLLISDLNEGLYAFAYTNPIPLDEIDSPYDVYKHYTNHVGASQIQDFVTGPIINRRLSCGDVVLLHSFGEKGTVVFMLVEIDTFTDKMNKHYQIQRDDSNIKDYPLYMYALGAHSGFQEYWNHDE